MEKSNLDRINDILFTDELSSEEHEIEMSLHKPVQEEATNWLGFNFAPIEQVHDFEICFGNITEIMNCKDEVIYEDCKTAMEASPPAPPQKDSQTEKYSINATHATPCMPQDLADATPIPAIPLVEQGNSVATANDTEMDATLPNPLLKQDSVTPTTAECGINATPAIPCMQEDFVPTPTLAISPPVTQDNPSGIANNTEMNATPPNPLPQQDCATPATAECAINTTLATPCMQQDFGKGKSCVSDDANPTPTPAIITPSIKPGNPSGTANNTEMDATPPNPLLQQDSAIPNLVLDAAPLSVKYHGMNEIIALNNGENGRIVKQGIKNASVKKARGARKKRRIILPAPWLLNYSLENKQRASSNVSDTYYRHNVLKFKCRSRIEVALFELHGITPNNARDEANLELLADAANFIKEFQRQNSEKKTSSTKKKRKRGGEKLDETNSAPTKSISLECIEGLSSKMNLDEKYSTVLEGANVEEGKEAKVNQKEEEGDVKQKQKVDGSQEGEITANQIPISESVCKFEESGLIDVPVLYCTEEEFKNLLSSNEGAMTCAVSKHETVMSGYKEDIGNGNKPGQTNGNCGELDEIIAIKSALATMEAQFNATKQALTIMEAKLDNMIEIEKQNRKLLQALKNGTKNPAAPK